MSNTVLKVEGLSKKFCRNLKQSIIYAAKDTTRSMLGISNCPEKLRKKEFWALKEVSFELNQGELLGIVGLNGSGKSTLLRLINGLLLPDIGQIKIKGSVGALIGVGAGFHPHMTGRENIYLNGTILGMTKQEIDDNYDDIVEFSGIGDFLEAPVATYSSGMVVRLGFSIAVHGSPDILLIDEILSVGDISFRNKGLRKMAEYRARAKALIFVSHNMEQVRVLCDKVMVLNSGKVVFFGDTHKALNEYEELSRKLRFDNSEQKSHVKARMKLMDTERNVVEVLDVGIKNERGEIIDCLGMSESLTIYIRFKLKSYESNLYFSVSVVDDNNYNCIWLISNENNKQHFVELKPGDYLLNLNIPEHHLMPNVYYINYAIRNQDSGETYEKAYTKKSIRVISDGNKLQRGFIAVKENWDLRKI